MASSAVQQYEAMSKLPTKNGKHMRNWSDFAAKRTKAMPDNSLFGSTLENLKPEQEINKNNIDLAQHRKQQEKKWRPKSITAGLPQEVKAQLPDLGAIAKSKRAVSSQRHKAEAAAVTMQSLEDRALHFLLKPSDARNNVPHSESVINAKPHQWITERDIIHANEINKVGLSSANNYDRDRFRKRPPVHKYSIIGDVLCPGMDFVTPRAGDGDDYLSTYANHFQTNPISGLPKKPATESLHLPANIRHSFGSKIVDEVLSDGKKVEDTIKHQQKLSKNSLERYGPLMKASALPHETPHPDYDEIGHSVRQNVVPGYTFNHKTSHVKSNFTKDVWDRRYTDPKEFRFQRDYQSTWAEQNIVREKLKKEYDHYYQEITAPKKTDS